MKKFLMCSLMVSYACILCAAQGTLDPIDPSEEYVDAAAELVEIPKLKRSLTPKTPTAQHQPAPLSPRAIPATPRASGHHRSSSRGVLTEMSGAVVFGAGTSGARDALSASESPKESSTTPTEPGDNLPRSRHGSGAASSNEQHAASKPLELGKDSLVVKKNCCQKFLATLSCCCVHNKEKK